MSTSSDEEKRRSRERDEYFRKRREMESRPLEEKLKEFSERSIQILSLSPDFELPFSKFIEMYQKTYKTQLYCSYFNDYKTYSYCESYTDVFKKLPEIFDVSHTYFDYEEGKPRGGFVQLTESVRRDAKVDRVEVLKNHPKLLQFERELVQLRDTLQGRGKIITVAEFPTYFWRHFGRTLKGLSTINDVR